MSARKHIEYVPPTDKFDLVTHRWDTQGNLTHKNLYRSFIVDHTRYYERPVNSGNLFDESNKPCGRVEYVLDEITGKVKSKSFNLTAEHRAYKPAPTGAELVAMERDQAKAELAAARAELEAIRKESSGQPKRFHKE